VLNHCLQQQPWVLPDSQHHKGSWPHVLRQFGPRSLCSHLTPHHVCPHVTPPTCADTPLCSTRGLVVMTGSGGA
jgi:hypothetical protein